ncbi:MAG: efflux transporter outer membrane subunit [Burkholderiales bacterium]|nr:efflux transporter outer membrane subunit [Burkholderiales bacterium]
MQRAALCALLPLALVLAACRSAPEYRRPDVSVPPQFKEAPAFKHAQNGSDGWQPAQPADLNGAPWWQAFNDQPLSHLMNDIELGNQNLRQAEARLRRAQAAIAGARAGLMPSVGANVSATQRRQGGSSGGSYSLGASASWEIDLWGRVRDTISASEAAAAASEYDLAATRLALQVQLARSYFQLRVADAQQRLLDEAVTSYERSLKLARDRFAAGVVSRADVVQAQAQLKAAEAQRLDVGIVRAQLEHAIAVLTGRAPAELALTPASLDEAAPGVPAGVPSTLLERRPDIAAAERRVAQANAQIGVAQAAYYPSLTLSGSGGFSSTRFADWLSLPSRFWSLGPQLAAFLFDGGARDAARAQALASYDETVAAYRQTVLTAFQEVEDNLAALNVLAAEERVQREALAAARQSLELVTAQYKAGTVSYLNVIQAQTTALQNELTVLALRGRRFAATVGLISAIGGDW